ncbi:MAG: hypothetical protein Q7R69_03470 [bacterium]|nr:hypothetical protein [bacterium]
MGEQSGGLVFFTIHEPADKHHNPRSALVIEALKEHGCTTVVVKSVIEAEAKVRGNVVVALCDVEFGVNRWSPRPTNTADGMPDWVRRLSTGSCVAVGRKCVTFPSHVKGAAQQIATMFSREFRQNGHEYPWGNGPSPHRRKRRSRQRLPHQHYLHSKR